MAKTEAQLTARLAVLADELAALAHRGQEIQKEIQKIVAQMPIDVAPKPSARAKRSRPKLPGKSAKARQQ
jgi:hypothetical protein